jgi:hypothetical protein
MNQDKQETPEQRKARLDQTRPTSDPQHPGHNQYKAQHQRPNAPQNLMLQIIQRNEQEEKQQQPKTPGRSEGL